MVVVNYLGMWNYGSSSGDNFLSYCLNTLRAAFSKVIVVSRSAEAVCIAVEDVLNGFPLELHVRIRFTGDDVQGGVVSQTEPPCFSIPHTDVVIPVHKMSSRSNSDSTAVLYVNWDSSCPDLVKATRQAFRVALMYWGKVIPPTGAIILQDLLRSQANGVGGFGSTGGIERLLHYPNELDLFVCQHPSKAAMRKEAEQTLDEMKKAIEENERLRVSIKGEQDAVVSLQSQLRNRLAEFRDLEQNDLFITLCTPEAVRQRLKKDVLRMDEVSRELARSALNTPSTNKRAFEESLERYRLNSVHLHLVKLKLTEYEKQLAET